MLQFPDVVRGKFCTSVLPLLITATGGSVDQSLSHRLLACERSAALLLWQRLRRALWFPAYIRLSIAVPVASRDRLCILLAPTAEDTSGSIHSYPFWLALHIHPLAHVQCRVDGAWSRR